MIVLLDADDYMDRGVAHILAPHFPAAAAAAAMPSSLSLSLYVTIATIMNISL
jgi:hypothetical protein